MAAGSDSLSSKAEATRARPWVLGISITIGVIVGLAVGWVAVAPTVILATVTGELSRPSVLDNAKLLTGTPSDFSLVNGALFEYKVGRANANTLLTSDSVFGDCQTKGRQCSTPVWSKGSAFYDANSPDRTPASVMCAQSFARGSMEGEDVHEVCVDAARGTLYYSSWSDGF